MSEYLQGKASLLSKIHKASISEQAAPLLAIILLGILKTSKRVYPETYVGLEGVFKTSSRHVLKTSSTRLQRNNFTKDEKKDRRQKIVTLKTS